MRFERSAQLLDLVMTRVQDPRGRGDRISIRGLDRVQLRGDRGAISERLGERARDRLIHRDGARGELRQIFVERLFGSALGRSAVRSRLESSRSRGVRSSRSPVTAACAADERRDRESPQHA